MDAEIKQLVKSDLLATNDKSETSTFSKLQEDVFGFAKEHSTGLMVAGGIAAAGIGLAALGRNMMGRAGAELTAVSLEGNLGEAVRKTAGASKGLLESSSKGLLGDAANASSKAGVDGLVAKSIDAPPVVVLGEYTKGLNRSGAQIMASLSGKDAGAEYVNTVATLRGAEIPRFAESFALEHPAAAESYISSMMRNSKLPEETAGIWARTLENIKQPGNFRTGEQLVKEFMGDGTPKLGSHFADVMKSMKGPEIPRFAREYAIEVPGSAVHNIGFIMERAPLAQGTESLWAKAMSDLHKAGFR